MIIQSVNYYNRKSGMTLRIYFIGLNTRLKQIQKFKLIQIEVWLTYLCKLINAFYGNRKH